MHILKCTKCGKYQLQQTCCKQKTQRVIPAKFTPQDKYAKYRRLAKKNVESHNS